MAPIARATVTVVFTGLPMGAVFRTPTWQRRAGGPPRRDGAGGVAGTGLPVRGEWSGVSAPSPAGPFAALPPQVDLPALEQEILQRWEADKVFARSMEATADRPQWVFYEGPPTANGRPGTHHIEARAFKDVFPRFKTMQGWHVPRRAGWDCHGLPVEIAVEQELGFAGKPDIERYGIAEFNARCRESVRAARRLVLRAHPAHGLLGRHVHGLLDDGPGLHRERLVVAQAGLRQGPAGRGPPRRPVLPALRHRPVRPRGRPGLRDPDRPVGLRPAAGHQRRVGRQGRPAGLDDDAVDAAVQHRRRRAPRRHLRGRPPRRRRTTPVVVAEPLLARRPGRGRARSSPARPAATGSGCTYQRPFELVEFPGRRRRPHFVVLADYVTTEDGTGLVHQSPAFGAEDLAVCRELRPARGQPDRRRPATSSPTSRWSAGTSSRPPTRRWSRT